MKKIKLKSLSVNPKNLTSPNSMMAGLGWRIEDIDIRTIGDGCCGPGSGWNTWDRCKRGEPGFCGLFHETKQVG